MAVYTYSYQNGCHVHSFRERISNMRQPSLEFISQIPNDQLQAIFEAFIERRMERFRRRPQKTLARATALQTAKFRESTKEVYRTQFFKVVNNLHALRGKTLLNCDVDDLRVAICLDGGGGGINRSKERSPAVDGDKIKELPLNVFALTARNGELAKTGNRLSGTASRYVSLFIDVFDSMIADQLRNNNPARLINDDAEPNLEHTSFFPIEQEKQFLVALQKHATIKSDWMRRRDRALFIVMLGAGLRPSEAVTLRISDLIWHNSSSEAAAQISIHVRSVNGIHDARSVPLEMWACPHVYRWAAERHNIRAKYLLEHQPNDLLFPQWASREPLDTNTVYCSMQTVIKLFPASEVAALAHIKGPNTLRNTFIVRALNRGESHGSLIEKVGLREIKALRRYVVMPYCPKVEKAA